MRIAHGVEMLELPADMMGQTINFNAALIWDDNDVILLDAGLQGMLPAIKKAIEDSGVPFHKLTKVILTHHDMDHLGGLPELLASAEQKIEVMAHVEEKPFIEGTKDLMEKIEKSLDSLSESEQEARRDSYRNRETVTVDVALSDKQVLPYCGGIEVIHTPGHTPGHICLYHKPSKTLITGDGTVAENGKLTGPNPVFTVNVAQAVSSLKKLLDYEIDTVICYHGGVVRNDIPKQLRDLGNA